MVTFRFMRRWSIGVLDHEISLGVVHLARARVGGCCRGSVCRLIVALLSIVGVGDQVRVLEPLVTSWSSRMEGPWRVRANRMGCCRRCDHGTLLDKHGRLSVSSARRLGSLINAARLGVHSVRLHDVRNATASGTVAVDQALDLLVSRAMRWHLDLLGVVQLADRGGGCTLRSNTLADMCMRMHLLAPSIIRMILLSFQLIVLLLRTRGVLSLRQVPLISGVVRML